MQRNLQQKLTFSIVGCASLLILMSNPSTAQTRNYGTTRTLRDCPSRIEPQTEGPSAEQAKRYFTCAIENEFMISNFIGGPILTLIDDLSIQVSPRSRRFTDADLRYTRQGGKNLIIDPDLPIYDIKGSYISYSCRTIDRTSGLYREVGKNCQVERFPDSIGICFRNAFGEWYCHMRGKPQKIADGVAPP